MGLGVKIAQALLVAFNFVFVLIGLAGIIAGAIIRTKYDDYIHLTSKDLSAVSILMIVLGGIIFLVAFFGCCGAMRKSSAMLAIYIIFLVLILILEIAGAITAYVYKGKLKDYIKDGMHYAMKHYNDTDDNTYKKAFDTVQQKLECCGGTNSSDWKTVAHLTAIPTSCCKSTKNETICSDPYKEGCIDALYDYLEEHMAIIGGIAVGVAVIQIAGIFFACVVRRDVKEGYGYV